MHGNGNSLAALRASLHAYGQLPPAQARTLPSDFYTDPRFHALETEQLLRHEWLCLGRADEIPQAGDYFTLQLLDEPLLVVRGDDGQIRVLSNICRHRGMLVAQGSGHARRFLCPYHAWSYGRDGRLLRAPRFETVPEFDTTKCQLPVLASELWNGFIYVNLDGEALPLASRLQGLSGVLRNYHTDQMHHVFVREEVWQVNWKCLVENFMEGYHLSVVHPGSLHPITPTALCEKFPAGEGYTGYKAYYPETAPNRGDWHPELDARERRCSTLFCVYPCHVVSQSPDLLVHMALQPRGVNSVAIRWGASTYEADLAREEIDRRIGLWETVNNEDRFKLERMQVGLRSRHSAVGPLAPADLEGTIWDFFQYLSRQLGDDIRRAP